MANHLHFIDSRDYMNATSTLLHESYENDGILYQAIDIALVLGGGIL